MKVWNRLPLVLVAFGFGAVPARAQRELSPRDLTRVSIEELMEVSVVSVDRREQPADAVPAAVYVISREDIRRSGMTSLPELLRLAPGVNVARIHSSWWAVSIRGFNDV